MYCIHDATFKKLMNDREFFLGFCQTYLPREIRKQIDWDSVEIVQRNIGFLQANTSMSEVHKSMADVVYQFKYRNGKPGLMILHVEHQSGAERFLSLRVLGYLIGTAQQYAKENNMTTLPSIIPIIYYHGDRSPYPYSLDVFDLFTDKSMMQKYLLHPILVDVNQYSDDELLENSMIPAADIAFKHVYNRKIEGLQVDYLLEALVREGPDRNVQSADRILAYAMNAWDYDKADFLKKIERARSSAVKEGVVTIAEQIRLEGVEQGLEQGREQARQQSYKFLNKFLLLGFSLENLQKEFSLSDVEIEHFCQAMQQARNDEQQ